MLNHHTLLEISRKYGTPVYVYDASVIRKQYRKLQEAFQTLAYEIHYAMKANENPEILNIFKDLGAKIDAVSTGEIQRALQVGFLPEDIIYTPSFPSLREIDFAIKNKIKIHIGEIYALQYIIEKYPGVSIGLRINPANSIEGNQKIATAHADSKFGIPLKDLDYVRQISENKIKIDALHIHTGSDVKSWQDLANSAKILFEQLRNFPEVKYLDLGSGFKVKYKPEDVEVDLKSYVEFIENQINKINKNLVIHFEPGKYLVSEAGNLLVEVIGIKQGYRKKFVGVNSGFHHLIRPMYYNAYHEIINLSNPNGEKEIYDVVGQLCEEDTFAYDRAIAKIRIGDVLAIKNAGAYGFAMASEYNLRRKPKEILVDQEKISDISQI